MQEKVIQTKVCKHCNSSFDITDNDLQLLEKLSPVFGGMKYLIPTPTLCPDCRQQRRLSFRNERNLYKRKCDATGKNIISTFSPDKPFKIYSHDEWWSDKWNPLDYGRDFDFSRGFFEQMKELMDDVPKLSIINFNSENSEYTNISADNKNCYLIVESSNNEDSMYSYWLQLSKNVIDSAYVNNSEICFECTNIDNGYNLKYSNRCINCSNSYFIEDCYGCSDCFACINLENNKYHVFNKEVTKEEYVKTVDNFLNGTYEYKQKVISEINDFFRKNLKKEPRIKLSENCSGDYIINSKDCYQVRDVNEAESCRYSSDVWRNSKNAMDANTFGRNAEIGYEVLNCAIDVHNILFSALCWINDISITYCYNCTHSSNLFGCVGIHSPHEYCILNKQYTKEEYEILVPKIIEYMKKTKEWGEFFPSYLSPFGYNETVANEYFPLTHSSVILSDGKKSKDLLNNNTTFLHGPIFNWSDYENPKPQVTKTIPASKLPDNIKEIPDDILNWAIIPDEDVRNDGNRSLPKPFRIIKPELEFYRKYNLPIPRKHPDQRHLDRMKKRNNRNSI